MKAIDASRAEEQGVVDARVEQQGASKTFTTLPQSRLIGCQALTLILATAKSIKLQKLIHNLTSKYTTIAPVITF